MIGLAWRFLDHPQMGSLAHALLEGDEYALYPFFDKLVETEDGDMHGIEVDKTYFIKTYAHYYIGRVVSSSFTEVVIDHIVEVYQTGPLEQFFTTGMPVRYNSVPEHVKATFPIMGSFVCAIEWLNPIPPERKDTNE